jgi:hypothetical protein
MEDAMLRCLLCGVIAALALAPAALADGPPSGVVQGGSGVLSSDGTVRYVTIDVRNRTLVLATRTKGGQVWNWPDYAGSWGIPLVAGDGSTGGLSADGRTLVLGESSVVVPLRSRTEFLVLDTKGLSIRHTIVLKGDFAFDALSPHGRRLYVIQRVSTTDSSRYVVRAVDLARGRLLPGRIADRTQRGWVMQGYAVTRATSAGGRWVYTLYQNPGGTPFVHALDTVAGVAHCIGIPWKGIDQSGLYNMRLSLLDRGRTLELQRRNGRSLLAVDTRTYRVSEPQNSAGGGFPWWTAPLGVAAVLVLLSAALGLATRKRAARAAPVGV